MQENAHITHSSVHQNIFRYMEMSNNVGDEIQIDMGSERNPIPTPIKFNTNATPNKYIAITTSPNGDNKYSFKVMEQKCSEFVYFLSNLSINHIDTEIAFHTIFIPRIKCQLHATSLSTTQITTLQRIFEPHNFKKGVQLEMAKII